MARTAGRWLALLVMIGPLGSQALAQVAPLPVPKITWRVENSFRFFSDAADTEVHRATFLALPPEDQLQHPILAAEQALSARHEDGWAETMFRDTCWDARNNRFACKDGGSYINPKSHRVIAEDQWRRRSRWLELHLVDGAARRRAARRGRHATVQRGCAFRHSLSGRVGGQCRDRRPRGGDREGRRQGSARRRHGRQLRLRRRQPRRAGALLA